MSRVWHRSLDTENVIHGEFVSHANTTIDNRYLMLIVPWNRTHNATQLQKKFLPGQRVSREHFQIGLLDGLCAYRSMVRTPFISKQQRNVQSEEVGLMNIEFGCNMTGVMC